MYLLMPHKLEDIDIISTKKMENKKNYMNNNCMLYTSQGNSLISSWVWDSSLENNQLKTNLYHAYTKTNAWSTIMGEFRSS